jgi:ComF family protein
VNLLPMGSPTPTMSLPDALSTSMRRILAQGLTSCAGAVDDLVFPWSCLLCGAEGATVRGPFCMTCRTGLLAVAAAAGTSACPRCALPTGPYADLQRGCAQCRGRSLGFDAALALAPYAEAIRDLCLRLKHERNAWLAPWLSSLFAEARQDELARLPRDTWIVPVPLHWWRRLERGYNQAEALAKGLSRSLGLRVCQPLRRIKATDRLAHKSTSNRMDAMRQAFRSRHDPGLNGRTILLVDDILTTGATCGAAARVLKQAGAKHIVVAVLARTL